MKSSHKRLTVGRRFLLCLVSGVPGLLASCVTADAPPAPSSAIRDGLRSVAIVPAQYAPQTDFLISWRHKEGATGKQAVLTTAAATATTAAASTAWLGPFAALTGAIAGGAMVVRSSLGTAQGIVPASTAAELESAISNAVSGLEAQSALAGQLAKMVEAEPTVRVAAVSGAGPGEPQARPDYAQLRTSGVDAVVETAINEIGFEGCIAHNRECSPPHVLYLFMRAQARLVRVEDGAVLFERDLEYKSGHRALEYWLADDGRSLGEELEQADRALAETVYDEVFLRTPVELPNSGGTDCWLQPLYPKFDMIHGARVEALQPTLRWTAFPRDIDREKLDPAVLNKISNVTYDLRIWDESTYERYSVPYERWRDRVIYERMDLEAAQHTLDVALAPGSRYYWAVRARFVVDGRPMATHWSRRRGCFSDEVPWGLHAFDTPRQAP
jgi:hypothetical protein